MSAEIRYPPKLTPRTYAATLEEQRAELATDEMMLRFAASRKELAADRYRPAYHYVNPEGSLNDPNGLCYWQGRYHLFYQAYPPQDCRQHWGHAVSDDLVRWEDLPLAIFPGIEEKVYSGSILVEEDRAIAFYHGTRAGIMVAVSSDPLLLNWEKIDGCPVIPEVEGAGERPQELPPERMSAPCLWKEEDGYYGLVGGWIHGDLFKKSRCSFPLFFSQDLRRWVYLGNFVEEDIYTARGEDTACPYFWPIGGRHILLFASHQKGSQYFLGDYDDERHRFVPSAHGRFNFNQIGHGGVHAPSATPDGQGGVYVIHNINEAKPAETWDDIMSLPRDLALDAADRLTVEPVAAIESLRTDHRQLGERSLPANEDVVLDGIAGRELEIIARIDPQQAREVCIDVCRSPDASEYTSIRFLQDGYLQRGSFREPRYEHAFVLDPTRSSLLPDVLPRPPEIAPSNLEKGDILEMRIFVDRSVVEVFANGEQCLAVRVYPQREDRIGVSIRAQGRDALLKSLDAWRIESIW